METIRGRLTAGYATALAVTLLVFTGALYGTRRRATYRELDQRIRSEADLTGGILVEIYRTGGLLIQNDAANRPVLTPAIAATLEAVPDFLLITHKNGRVLFASADTRALTFDEFEQMRQLALGDTTGRDAGTARVQPKGPTIRYVVRPARDAGPQFGAIVAGSDAAQADPQPMIKDEFGRLAETLNQMMARLERSFVALRRFTADASHELKTPLTVLRAGVERVSTTPGLPAETLPVLEETLQEVNRMTELVDALLTLARADEGRVPLHREPVDLRAIVAESQETGELLAEEARVAIAVTMADRPVMLEVDQSRIRQLLLNLLTNAVKYTPAGGRVEIRLTDEPARVVLVVADTGIGIAPGDLPHIFDRFYRADTARTRTGERPGAGLGLAICKWIAEAHGGEISVQSRPGRGTTFTVTLPRGAA